MKQKNIVVFCRHPGVLLHYCALLNEIGHFQVAPYSSLAEVLTALTKAKKIDCLILDDFLAVDSNKKNILHLSHLGKIKSFLLLGDLSFQEQSHVFAWARKHHIPLSGTIKQPASASDFKRYIDIYSYDRS